LRRQGPRYVSDAHGRGRAGPPSGGPAQPRADVCAGRAAVYEVLTYGFSEPGTAYVEALASGQVVALLRAAIGWLHSGAAAYEPAFTSLTKAGATLAAAGEAEALRDLRVEHARLFTGPGRPAVLCYASEHLRAGERRPGRLNGSAATEAEAAYQAEGVAPAQACGDLPDHVTIELEFLFHLCRREQAAWAADDANEAKRLRRALDDFLRGHACTWLAAFAASVRSCTEQQAYSGMAELLSAHLAVELGDAAPSGAAGPQS
jgi:TorA maturation chaperone TorD